MKYLIEALFDVIERKSEQSPVWNQMRTPIVEMLCA
jgi:hypothetical protein